jgi:hypothetical protein
MSRGYGKRQGFWLDLARNRFSDFDASEGWTFSQVCEALWPGTKAQRLCTGMRGFDLHATEKRSMRRALQGLVRDRVIIAIGGPSSPKRAYLVNPHILNEDNPLRAKILESLALDGLTVSPCGHFTSIRIHTEHLAGSPPA